MEDRRLFFEKIQNARDLGGLKTMDGRSITPGMLIRSAGLFAATEADVKKLQEEHHLSKVIDLRTSMEKKEKPDVCVDPAEYCPIPIFDERMFGISHEEGTDKSPEQKQKDMQKWTMENMYLMLVTNEVCRANLGKAARTVMEHDFSKGSVLWHCTEGKDRCGLLAVILLTALGVDRQTIIDDYLMTNEVNAPKAEKYYQHFIASGKSVMEAEAVRNAYLAKESYLTTAFSAIEEQFQDMDTYLRDGLAIPEETILKFRDKIL